MRMGVPRERAEGEARVALIPPVARRLVDRGIDVCVEAGAGERSDWSDEAYRDAGCEVVAERSAVFERADVVVQVRALGADDRSDVDPYREGQVVIGMLGPYSVGEGALEALADRDVSAFALELIPRISRAQSMDVLSSMASLGGYKSAVMAADALPKLFPMQMTAAGTVRPAEVFVVGAGVAGLQAIATARRLGASVRAYDIRPEVKEEVESLGADFVELDLETDDASDEGGHAREQDEAFYEKQREMMHRVVADSDVVITSAAVPGRPSPELVTAEMIDGMEPGSVIVDLAAEGGGNCEPTVPGETVEYAGVTVFGPTDLPSTLRRTASQLYANNVKNFLSELLDDGELAIDLDDQIVDATLLTHGGAVRNPHLEEEAGDGEDEATDEEDEATGGEAEADGGVAGEEGSDAA